MSRAAVIILWLLLSVVARADDALPPKVDVLTMGPGDALFTRFGHAAICVDGTCWNYGTADFSDPIGLGWKVLRGRAMFWVATGKEDEMIELYQSRGRGVWVQTLALPVEVAEDIRDKLVDVLFSDDKYFAYHHFRDNCTTRVRDVLNRATGGVLATGDRRDQPSLRQMVRAGFAGDPGLLLVGELILGRAGDRPTTRWEAMFLPSVLRSVVADKLKATPRVVAAGPTTPPGRRWWGTAILWLAAVGLWLWVRRFDRHPRLGLFLPGIVLGLLGLGLWTLSVVAVTPELRFNENVLLFWPTDIALPWLRRRYLSLRMGVLMLVLLGHLTTLLVQPLAPVALALLPLSAALWVRTTEGWFKD